MLVQHNNRATGQARTGTDLLTLMMASLIISISNESAGERDHSDVRFSDERRAQVLDHAGQKLSLSLFVPLYEAWVADLPEAAFLAGMMIT